MYLKNNQVPIYIAIMSISVTMAIFIISLAFAIVHIITNYGSSSFYIILTLALLGAAVPLCVVPFGLAIAAGYITLYVFLFLYCLVANIYRLISRFLTRRRPRVRLIDSKGIFE